VKITEYVRLGLRYHKDPFFVKYLMGKRVLDIGAGRGEFLAREPGNFFGVDLDPVLVSQCHQRNLTAYCMSAFQLGFPDGSFDAVHAAQLIEHFSPADASRFLGEVSRVIRPGGWVFLTTPGVRNVWNTFSHVRPYPPNTFLKLLRSDTENYIRGARLDLSYEGAWGTRHYFESRAIMFLSGVVDLLMPTANPIGWTIVLRKK
jgi:SAM-dependent methyltransferase